MKIRSERNFRKQLFVKLLKQTKDFFYGLSCSLKVLFVEKLQEGRVTIEEAAEDAGMTVEEFKKVMENTSLQAV